MANRWIVLTPVSETFVNGTRIITEINPRPAQEFWVIWPGGSGIVSNMFGTTRKFDFILVGDWDAEVEIGDHWVEGAQKYQITFIEPYNGYEVKCGGVSVGAHPNAEV